MFNLSRNIQSQLPAELVDFIRAAATIATKQGQKLYLVGGVVRDLLLGKANLDLDLVVEGDAINIARQLLPLSQGKMTTHPTFGTANIQWDEWSIDLATARSESYAKPGALPIVKPSSIDNDLFRRDFTVNAMAVDLSPSHYGELIDLYAGKDDLEQKLIRVLHNTSFIDDATRIWRGLRYEQRLDFKLETKTLRLLKRDIPMLDTINGDRIRYELECVLEEELPEKILRRADELGVLARLHPSLKGNGWLAEKFKRARQLCKPELPSLRLYLTLLAYPFTSEETEQLISYLRLPKSLTQTLRDTNSLKANLKSLADPEITPSGIYQLLHDYSSEAIMVIEIASDVSIARQHIRLFLNKLCYVKPVLTGNDLKKMGITGPRIKEILNLLLEARLVGKVSSKQDEEEMVKGWVN